MKWDDDGISVCELLSLGGVLYPLLNCLRKGISIALLYPKIS
jgi:hypothetical protein